MIFELLGVHLRTARGRHGPPEDAAGRMKHLAGRMFDFDTPGLVDAIQQAMSKDDTTDWEGILDEDQLKYGEARRRLKDHIALICEGNGLEILSNNDDDRKDKRADQFLQPFVLSKDNTLAELWKWQKQVMEYCESAKLVKQPILL